MKLSELSYKIGDEIFRGSEIGNITIDPVRFEMRIYTHTDTSCSVRVVSCDPQKVEVIVYGA